VKRLALFALSAVLAVALVAGGTAASAPSVSPGDAAAGAAKKKKKKACPKGTKRAKKGPKKGKCVKKKKKKPADSRHCYAASKCTYLRSADGMEAQFNFSGNSSTLKFPRELVYPIPGCGPEPPGDPILKNIETYFLYFKVDGTQIGESTLTNDPTNTGGGGGSTSDGRSVTLRYDIQGRWTAFMRAEGTFTATQTRRQDGAIYDECSRTVPFVLDRK
jgi:hypothetical protein